MQHLNADTVHALLDYPSLVEALRVAHHDGSMPEARVQVLSDRSNEANKFVTLVAWASGDVIAVKLVGVFPDNPSLPVPEPSVQGLVTLISGKTGAPLMTCDGAALTFRKTAADSALAVDLLARKDAKVLLVLGAGGLAPHVIEAHTSVRPSISRVMIWNRNPQKATDLAARLKHLPIDISAVDNLNDALAQADIVSSVTMATEPLVNGALLKSGCHVDLIGAYMPEMREADDDVARRAGRIFVDTRSGCEGSGEVAEPLARGLITREQIVADLFDLCQGRHAGRSGNGEITMFKNVGGGHLDLFTARHLLARADVIG
ncbi:ornithine cyclodeaminase [Pararhizobium sp. YC-54]|uniref:ornithine cyclodeaminase n=1 Tax=Pararhizobium sp. YC-54 TaxID=2986920 RepID=UPI0021F74D2C|nr:ornithine cyclodeaminase [Pararhizobium sp. YC-54]MCW0001045.1 ornithine cyclodeaminase [Pararhizobium sp. YC-54]